MQPTTENITLEEITRRKQEISNQLSEKGDSIHGLWCSLATPQKANSKGEMISHIISNAITAFDAFMLMRKLTSQYGHLFTRKRKK